jgi:hypothetical protein
MPQFWRSESAVTTLTSIGHGKISDTHQSVMVRSVTSTMSDAARTDDERKHNSELAEKKNIGKIKKVQKLSILLKTIV